MTLPGSRFPWHVYWVALAIIAVFTLWPVASVTLTYWIADANGCRVDEGNMHPCIIGGHDLGALLYTMGVMGWFMLASLPLGFGAAIVWLITLLIHRSAWRRSGKPAS
ncbi:hypothetical protein [uncultured Devosia sp.]|uniref:hypothetical protein n=1 Tax=uncultured Devosia sp. TaxID=211434 RepID=UPI0035CC2D8A